MPRATVPLVQGAAYKSTTRKTATRCSPRRRSTAGKTTTCWSPRAKDHYEKNRDAGRQAKTLHEKNRAELNRKQQRRWQLLRQRNTIAAERIRTAKGTSQAEHWRELRAVRDGARAERPSPYLHAIAARDRVRFRAARPVAIADGLPVQHVGENLKDKIKAAAARAFRASVRGGTQIGASREAVARSVVTVQENAGTRTLTVLSAIRQSRTWKRTSV